MKDDQHREPQVLRPRVRQGAELRQGRRPESRLLRPSQTGGRRQSRQQRTFFRAAGVVLAGVQGVQWLVTEATPLGLVYGKESFPTFFVFFASRPKTNAFKRGVCILIWIDFRV